MYQSASSRFPRDQTQSSSSCHLLVLCEQRPFSWSFLGRRVDGYSEKYHHLRGSGDANLQVLIKYSVGEGLLQTRGERAGKPVGNREIPLCNVSVQSLQLADCC
ncbi:hypothetical protein RRG08_058463 [Elysia crispata]|uniref:Uncharacterized protein n=1 Tax=Elysia crispata TaxID=231223 RepID=A0AAE0Y6J6_9GAST|nr:hypothetical protein RRG08_058463 [Elysia crispata]